MMPREILIATALLALAGCNVQPSNTTAEADLAADNLEAMADNMDAMANEAIAAASPTTNSSGWIYNEKKDEMRGATTKTATVESSTPLNLDFPYGESTPRLHVRQDPKWGFDIFITANGPFLCRSYDDTVSVKFDNGPIREWSCAEGDGGSSDIIFFNREQSFLAELKKAKKVIVEVSMYNAGRQQITFPVAGLKWE